MTADDPEPTTADDPADDLSLSPIMTTTATPTTPSTDQSLKRAGAPRFTATELEVVRKAAALEDRDVANLVRVATLRYAKDVISRHDSPPR